MSYSVDETSHRRWSIGMSIYYAAFVAGLAALTGCQALTPRIVTTEIRKTADVFEIISPKDTDVTFAGRPDGYFFFRYNAHASPEALTAGTAEANARAEAVGRLAEAAAALK